MFDEEAYGLAVRARYAKQELEERLKSDGVVTHFSLQMHTSSHGMHEPGRSESFMLDLTTEGDPLSLLEPTRVLLQDNGPGSLATVLQCGRGHRASLQRALAAMATPQA